jgi:hypothetical protein
VSLEKYQILMHMEQEQSFHLVFWDFTSGSRGHKLTFDEGTGKAAERELTIKIEPKYVNFIDDFEKLEDSDLVEFAESNQLNPHRLKLYRDIFQIYDEGTFECVVWVQSVHFSRDHYFHKIVNVEKGS